MRSRMSREKRRGRLLGIMRDLHAKAKTVSDFSVKKIAEAEGISEVWVYELIGEEFETLRSEFIGTPTETEVDILRRENAELRRANKEWEEKFKIETTGNYAEAITIIEAQDEEIRALNGLIKLYEKRLQEYGLPVILRGRQQTGRKVGEDADDEMTDLMNTLAGQIN